MLYIGDYVINDRVLEKFRNGTLEPGSADRYETNYPSGQAHTHENMQYAFRGQIPPTQLSSVH